MKNIFLVSNLIQIMDFDVLLVYLKLSLFTIEKKLYTVCLLYINHHIIFFLSNLTRLHFFVYSHINLDPKKLTGKRVSLKAKTINQYCSKSELSIQ